MLERCSLAVPTRGPCSTPGNPVGYQAAVHIYIHSCLEAAECASGNLALCMFAALAFDRHRDGRTTLLQVADACFCVLAVAGRIG